MATFSTTSAPSSQQGEQSDVEKCLSTIASLNSPDPLIGAAKKGAQAMRACLKEDDVNGVQAMCAIERLGLEIVLSKRVDGGKDQPLRAVLYGVLEAAQETMAQMHARLRQAQEQLKQQQESDGGVETPPPPQAVFPGTPMDAVSTTAAILLQPQLLQSIVVKKEKNEPQQQEQPQQEHQLDAVVDEEAVKSTPSLQTAGILLQPQLRQSRVKAENEKDQQQKQQPPPQQQQKQQLEKDAGKDAETPPPQLQTAGILLQPQLRQSRVLKGEKENDETQPQQEQQQEQQEKAADEDAATLQLQAQAAATSSAPHRKRCGKRRIPLVACLICQERLPVLSISAHFDSIHGQTLAQARLTLCCVRCGVEKTAPSAMYEHAKKKKTRCSLLHCIMIEKGKEMGEGEQEQN